MKKSYESTVSPTERTTPLCVPNELFFSQPQAVNLNAVYDTKNSRYTVRGLIHILNRYKFTIAENTPIEEEVALRSRAARTSI